MLHPCRVLFRLPLWPLGETRPLGRIRFRVDDHGPLVGPASGMYTRGRFLFLERRLPRAGPAWVQSARRRKGCGIERRNAGVTGLKVGLAIKGHVLR